MPVGTNIGNVLNSRQGEGYATVVDGTQQALSLLKRKDLLDAQKRAETQAKQEKRDKAKAEFEKFDPDYFYAHDKEMSQMIEDTKQKGIQAQVDGIDDPFTSSDPKAIEFQKNKKYTGKVAEVSTQMKDQFLKMQKVYNTEGKRDKISNWGEIQEWFYDTSPKKVLDEGIPFPTFQFKAPAFDTMGRTNEAVKTWQSTNPNKAMSDDDAYFLADQMLANPADNEMDGYVPSMKQLYSTLLPEDQKKYVAKAKRNSDGSLDAQVREFMADRIKLYSGVEVDLSEEVVKAANQLELSQSIKEEGGKLKSGEYIPNQQEVITTRLNSMLKANDGQIELDVKRGLYGSPDNLPEENYAEAFAHYYPLFNNSIAKKFSEKEVKGKVGEEEIAANYNDWYERLNSSSSTTSKEAAMFLAGSKGVFGGTVSDAEVIDLNKLLKNNFPGRSKSFPKVDYPVLAVETTENFKLPTGAQVIKMRDSEKEELEKLTGKKNVEYFELNPTNKQAFKKLHRQGVKAQGAPYEPTIETTELENYFFNE